MWEWRRNDREGWWGGEGLLLGGGRGDKHTVGAILPDPAGEALAGAVDGVAGAVVGAAADLGAGSAEPAARADCGGKKEPTTSKQLKGTQ